MHRSVIRSFAASGLMHLIASCAILFIYTYGGKSVAFAVNNVGNSQLAEKIFAHVRDERDEYTHKTVASYLWTAQDECDGRQQKLKALVHQYGSESPEMAALYVARAGHLDSSGDLTGAEVCLKESLKIYSKVAAPDLTQVHVKALLGYLKARKNNLGEARVLFNEALEQSEVNLVRNMALYNVPGVLVFYPENVMSHDLKKKLFRRSQQIENIENASGLLASGFPFDI